MPNNEEQKVVYISSSSNYSIISLVSKDNNNNAYYNLLHTDQLDTEDSPIQPFFSAGYHTNKINHLTKSVAQSIFCSCSMDNTVKIWNYYENDNPDKKEKKGIISQSFKEEPLSASLHPFGMFVAVCFATGFKVFAILNDSFYPLKEVTLTNCKIIQYSHGGHYLVTNEKNNILIYETIYYDTILQVLEGHPALIKDIAISEDDILIISTCINGYVFCWNLLKNNNGQGKEIVRHQEESLYN